MQFIYQVKDNGRVNIATAGSHHQARKWPKPHTGIYTFATGYCRHTAPISQMNRNDLAAGLFRCSSPAQLHNDGWFHESHIP